MKVILSNFPSIRPPLFASSAFAIGTNQAQAKKQCSHSSPDPISPAWSKLPWGHSLPKKKSRPTGSRKGGKMVGAVSSDVCYSSGLLGLVSKASGISRVTPVRPKPDSQRLPPNLRTVNKPSTHAPGIEPAKLQQRGVAPTAEDSTGMGQTC